jgi:hypothetical protein
MAYERGDLRAAKNHLDAAFKAARTKDERARTSLYLGLTLASLRDLANARQAFRAALTESPELSIDRDRVAPGVLALFDQTRQSLTGKLVVTAADEPDARLFVDGREISNLAKPVLLSIGHHHVRVLSRNGLRAFDAREILVRPDEETRLEARLRLRRGRLVLSSRPVIALVFRGSQLIGSSAAPIAMAAGEHRLVVRAENHHDETVEVHVEPDADVKLAVTLRRLERSWIREPRSWGWITLGGSAGALVAALTFGQLARGAASDLAAEQRQGPIQYSRFVELQDRATSRALASNLLFAVSGAGALTGALILFFSRSGPSPTARSARFQIAPSLGGLSAKVTF